MIFLLYTVLKQLRIDWIPIPNHQWQFGNILKTIVELIFIYDRETIVNYKKLSSNRGNELSDHFWGSKKDFFILKVMISWYGIRYIKHPYLMVAMTARGIQRKLNPALCQDVVSEGVFPSNKISHRVIK